MRSVERSIDVLEVLESAGRPLRLAEVAARTGLHIATAQRLLATLEGRGRVERDAAGYRAGVNLIFGAHAYLTTSPLVLASRPVIQELADRTGRTVSLFVRSGWSRVVVARVSGDRPLHFELPIGSRLPLHLGAGKTLAAHLDPGEVDALLAEVGDIVTVQGTSVSPEEFRASLQQIRDQGFQIARSERSLGSVSVSAPVRHRETGDVVAALTIGAAAEDVTEDDLEKLSLEVRRAVGVLRVQ